MRLAVASLALLLSAPAYAGGIGVIVAGGAHTETTWFYSDVVTDDSGETIDITDPSDFEQYEIVQTLPHGGGGLELILGDRDDRITGIFRFYYQMDAPQGNPAELTNEVAAEHVVAAYRETPRHLGIGVVGLSWNVLGNPESFQAGLTGHVGSGFLTNDHTEFLTFDLGPTFSYRMSRQLQAFADVGYVGRYRKGLSNGAQAVAGVRYMFD